MKKFIAVVMIFVLLSLSLTLVASAADVQNYEDVFPTAFAVSNQKEIVRGKYATSYNISVVFDDGKGMIVSTNPETYASVKEGDRLEINLATKTVVVRSDASDALKTIMKSDKKYFAVFNDGTMKKITVESLYNFYIGMSHEEVMRESGSEKADVVTVYVFLSIIPAGIILWFLYGFIVCLVTRRREETPAFDYDYDEYDSHY